MWKENPHFFIDCIGIIAFVAWTWGQKVDN